MSLNPLLSLCGFTGEILSMLQREALMTDSIQLHYGKCGMLVFELTVGTRPPLQLGFDCDPSLVGPPERD